MKSSTRNIIVVGAVAVVLGGTVFALTKVGGSGGATSSGSSSTGASSAAIQLISKTSSDVASMKVTNKKGSYTLMPLPSGGMGASASSGTASSANYTVQELGGCPVDTGETGSVVQSGFSLTATKNLGKVSSLANYGLDNPQATVQVTFKDGSTYGYKIGSTTATDSSAYYMCGLESSDVYVVNVDTGLFEDAKYFVTKSMITLSGGTNAGASTGGSSSQNDFSLIALSGKNFPQATSMQKNASGQFAISSPLTCDTDSNSLTALENALSSVSADSVVALRPDAAALKQYGLDHPTVSATFTANKKPYQLMIGAQNGKDYYAMIGGVNVVYNVTSDSISGILTQNLFSLRSKLIYLPNIVTVKQITVTSNGKTDEMNVTRTDNPASSTQDKKAYNYKVTGNGGKSLNYDTDYRDTYQTLIGLAVYADANKIPSGSPAITVKYTYFDKAGSDTLALYQLDGRRYTAVFDGKVYGLCDKNDVAPVLQTIANFEAGKSVAAPT